MVTLSLSDDQLARLDSIETRIDELHGFILSRTDGYIISVDTDAAGFGWFVDLTPALMKNSNFLIPSI